MTSKKTLSYMSKVKSSLLSRLLRFSSIILFITIVSACSQLPNLLGNTEPQKTETLDEQITDDVEADNTSEQNTAPPLTPDELKIQALSARPNMYALSKRTLSAQTKREVLAALDSFKNGKLEQSQKQINDVLNNRLDVNSAVYVLAGDISIAQVKAQFSNNSETNRETAEQVVQAGKNGQKHYEKALSFNPDNAKAANRLAKLLREQGEFSQAEALYSQAINAQPMHASSYRNRAVLRDLYMNKKALALKDYQDYSTLLKHQQKQNEEGKINLPEQSQKALAKDIQLVSRWLVDIERQVDALTRTQAANNANTGGGE